jgi:MoaA/NifB/PqqE/SkfB family radical SAM enzyme
MKILLMAARFFFHKRIRRYHVAAFLEHSTLKKTLNFILNNIERIRHASRLRSKPYVLDLEMTNACNYRCPFCSTGKGLGGRFGKVKPADIEKLIKDIGGYVYAACLHFRGEPLLNGDLPGIVDLFHKSNIHTVMSTNLSLLDEQTARSIIAAKLDHLIAAIDGTTGEVYEKYRRGGNFETVTANLRRLVRLKRELKSSRPHIEWQFVVFKHNIHQIAEAKAMGRELGVDSMAFIPAYVEDDSFAVEQAPFKSYSSRILPLNRRTDCKSLWAVLTLGWDGAVAACCWEESIESGFGNVFETGFPDVWNNEKFRSSREMIRRGPGRVRAGTICDSCAEMSELQWSRERRDAEKKGERV